MRKLKKADRKHPLGLVFHPGRLQPNLAVNVGNLMAPPNAKKGRGHHTLIGSSQPTGCLKKIFTYIILKNTKNKNR